MYAFTNLTCFRTRLTVQFLNFCAVMVLVKRDPGTKRGNSRKPSLLHFAPIQKRNYVTKKEIQNVALSEQHCQCSAMHPKGQLLLCLTRTYTYIHNNLLIVYCVGSDESLEAIS